MFREGLWFANSVQVDAIAEDLRVEIGVMIEEWRRKGPMFKVT